MCFAWFGQVGDAGVRTHQNVGRVEAAFQELLLRLVQVDPAQRRLWNTSQNRTQQFFRSRTEHRCQDTSLNLSATYMIVHVHNADARVCALTSQQQPTFGR